MNGEDVRMRRLVACSLLLAAAGCASGTHDPASTPAQGTSVVRATSGDLNANLAASGEPTQDLVQAPQEQVLRAVNQAYTGLGLAASVDPRGNAVGTGAIDLRGRIENRPHSVYFNCGITAVGQQAADVHRVTISVRSSVSPAQGGGTYIRTLVEGSAKAQTGGATTPVRCASTGQLERRIVQIAQVALAAAQQ